MIKNDAVDLYSLIWKDVHNILLRGKDGLKAEYTYPRPRMPEW